MDNSGYRYFGIGNKTKQKRKNSQNEVENKKMEGKTKRNRNIRRNDAEKVSNLNHRRLSELNNVVIFFSALYIGWPKSRL